MPVPSTTVGVNFTTSIFENFTLDDPVRGVLDNTGFTLGGGTAVFTDVSSDVLSVTVNRGKSRRLDHYPSGRATVRLQNRARKYDPYYSSGPYFNQITTQREVRIQTAGSAVYLGQIDDWSFEYDVNRDSVASMHVTDALALFGAQTLGTAYAPVEQTSGARIDAVLSRPEVGWPGGRSIDTGLATLASAPSIPANTKVLNYLQSIESSEPGDFYVDAAGDVVFKQRNTIPGYDDVTPTTYRYNLMNNPSFETNTTGWNITNATISRVTTDSFSGSASLQIVSTSTTNNVGARFNASGAVRIPCALGETFTISAYVKNTVGTRNIAPSWRAFPSATSNTVTESGSGAAFAVTNPTVWTRISNTFTISNALSTYFDVFIKTNNTGAIGDTYLADAVLIEKTSTLGSYFDGNSTNASWDGTTNNSTSTLTIPGVATNYIFSDTGLATHIPYVGIDLDLSSELLYNRVIVTRQGGIAQTASDTISQAKYGVQTLELSDILLSTDAQALDLATWLVNIYKNPLVRVNRIETELAGLSTSQQAKVLGLELGEIAELQFTPNGIGSAIDVQVKIIGISHQITPSTHRVIFETESTTTNLLILDDLQFGLLNSGILGF